MAEGGPSYKVKRFPCFLDKDIFCRYKTQQGYQVSRRAGWDTHGLPIELQVEKELGITKVDIGHSISIEAYNAQCRDTVLRYTAAWEAMTKKMGFWIDMKSAYRTCDASYIESVWWLLGQLYTRDLLYKGIVYNLIPPQQVRHLANMKLTNLVAIRRSKT